MTALPRSKSIGTEDFFVAVVPQCSGVESFALITVFLTLYMGLFRRDLRFPRAATCPGWPCAKLGFQCDPHCSAAGQWHRSLSRTGDWRLSQPCGLAGIHRFVGQPDLGVALCALFDDVQTAAHPPVVILQVLPRRCGSWPRVLGTSLLVPVIEELFFRGYLLDRIGWNGPLQMALGILISATPFAMVQDKYIAAALAGLIFGALVCRSGNMTDAIICHAVANTLIAGRAVITVNWYVI